MRLNTRRRTFAWHDTKLSRSARDTESSNQRLRASRARSWTPGWPQSALARHSVIRAGLSFSARAAACSVGPGASDHLLGWTLPSRYRIAMAPTQAWSSACNLHRERSERSDFFIRADDGLSTIQTEAMLALPFLVTVLAPDPGPGGSRPQTQFLARPQTPDPGPLRGPRPQTPDPCPGPSAR